MSICIYSRCLHYFASKEKLRAHVVDCGTLNDCAIILPSDDPLDDDKWLSFDNYSRKERMPFVVYADIECILENKDDDPATVTSSRRFYQHHTAYSVGYYVHCAYNADLSSYNSYRGTDCLKWFSDEMYGLALRVQAILNNTVQMAKLTPEESNSYCNATHCYACEKPFDRYERRVRDHCHITGRYRGAAHPGCNLRYRDPHVIPVIFHNLTGYDAHFIINDVANAYPGRVDLLPLTKEAYISFTKHVLDTMDIRDDGRRVTCMKLRFVDSYKFLADRLDRLASYLDTDKLRITRKQFAYIDAEDFALVTRKGVFPYEYVDDANKLNDTRLPPRESFFSSLTDEIVSESEYEHATNVWERFGIRTLGEYSDLYLKTDVLLLADVFEQFRNTCMDSYGLDPAHYYTLPGYTWDAMLRYTGIRFELFTDIDMLMFVERGIRGGLSQCSNRYARANNKYMRTYNESEESKFLMYFDVNNLYGWAMCQPLPYADFAWIDGNNEDRDAIASFDVMSVAFDSSIGYILEVDIEYPRNLHDSHVDLPFCPLHGKSPTGKHEKLLATLHSKERYVIYYRNLQQCIRHGLRVTKIHRILRFSQSPWLARYIELNTQLRTNARNDFEKNLYKLMNNAVFGKTMENVRKHVDVRLVTKWDGRGGAEEMISKPNFHSRSVFSEDLMAVELRRLKVHFYKPIYVGMCILDISKMRLYEFHYEYMVPRYGDKARIMYTDTDSLIYSVECADMYNDMKRDIDRFDTSDYAIDNAYGIPLANKRLPGLMKDENNGAIMTEFVGLRAKMYAIRVDGRSDTKKSKGVKSSVVARTISFDDYLQCLREEIEMKRRQSCIRSTLHDVYTVSEAKIALSPYDDKRYVVPNTTDTLPWGHYKIP